MFKTIISAVKAMGSVLALVLAFTLNASAQDAKPTKAEKTSERMKTELSLNDAQYTKVLEINKSYEEKTAEVRRTSTDREANIATFKTLNEDREAQLKKVFTEDQYKNYLVKKEEKKASRKSAIQSGQPIKTKAAATNGKAEPAKDNIAPVAKP